MVIGRVKGLVPARAPARLMPGCVLAFLVAAGTVGAAETNPTSKPTGHPAMVDTTSLRGKVMCGYQGWFGTPNDGGARGWTHWGGRNGFQPGSCCIDLWPEVSELDPDERVATPFLHQDGRPAEVFSPFNRKTVLRHFKWMQESGIDGVFVQRFITDVSYPIGARHFNVVLDHCREGANLRPQTNWGRMRETTKSASSWET